MLKVIRHPSLLLLLSALLLGSTPSCSEEPVARTDDRRTEYEDCTRGHDTGQETVARSVETLDAGRYCEVLIAYEGDDGTVTADVYNSLLFGSCPQALWEQLDADVIRSDFPDAIAVTLNGPRYFLMQHMLGPPDQETSPATPMVHNFGGIPMMRAATVSADLLDRMAYSVITVNRSNTWRFSSGHRVHELINPLGQIYVMQSFAQSVDPDLSYDDLADLGAQLALPQGWRYRSRILESVLDVRATGVAEVLQDELANTYQRRTDCRISD